MSVNAVSSSSTSAIQGANTDLQFQSALSDATQGSAAQRAGMEPTAFRDSVIQSVQVLAANNQKAIGVADKAIAMMDKDPSLSLAQAVDKAMDPAMRNNVNFGGEKEITDYFQKSAEEELIKEYKSQIQKYQIEP